MSDALHAAEYEKKVRKTLQLTTSVCVRAILVPVKIRRGGNDRCVEETDRDLSASPGSIIPAGKTESGALSGWQQPDVRRDGRIGFRIGMGASLQIFIADSIYNGCLLYTSRCV